MNWATFPRSSSYFCSLTKRLILAQSSSSCSSAIHTATSVIFFRTSAFFYQLRKVSIASDFTLPLSASNAACWSIKQLCNSAKTCFIFLMDTSLSSLTMIWCHVRDTVQLWRFFTDFSIFEPSFLLIEDSGTFSIPRFEPGLLWWLLREICQCSRISGHLE